MWMTTKNANETRNVDVVAGAECARVDGQRSHREHYHDRIRQSVQHLF